MNLWLKFDIQIFLDWPRRYVWLSPHASILLRQVLSPAREDTGRKYPAATRLNHAVTKGVRPDHGTPYRWYSRIVAMFEHVRTFVYRNFVHLNPLVLRHSDPGSLMIHRGAPD